MDRLEAGEGTQVKTIITQEIAARRLHQGLFYLLGTTDAGHKAPELDSILAVSTVMAYSAAYAFPDCNLYEAKQRMLSVFEPLKNALDAEQVLTKAFQLAEVSRRPWSEPRNGHARTI